MLLRGMGLGLLFSVADWIVVYTQRNRVKYVTKPLVILILILWLYLETRLQGFTIFFAVGLFFSLLGDIWLMLPGRYFLAGLFSFLLAHCAYIIGLNQAPLPFSTPTIIAGALVILAALLITARIRFGFMRMIGTLRVRFPLALYSIALTLMLVSGFSTLFRPSWDELSAWLTTTGALFFFISDSMLGFDRFVRPFAHARLWIRITYHLGQILLIGGAINQSFYL